MTTLDFELEIGPGVAGSYPVLARAPGGEAASTLRWSVTPAALDHQLAVIKDKVLVSSAVVRRVPTEDEQPVRELGRRLFEALIADHVLALYVTSRQHARENGGRRLATASNDNTARIARAGGHHRSVREV